MQSPSNNLQKKSKLAKPYNNYNLFFILERTLIIEAKQIGATAASYKMLRPSLHSNSNPTTASSVAADTPPSGYEFIELPPLPPRYQHLKSSLVENWYDPERNKLVKRKHSKSHGIVSFREIVRTVADNWKTIDTVTKAFVESVAILLKQRHQEMGQMGGLGCFSVGQPPNLSMMPFSNSTSCQMTMPTKLTKRVSLSTSQTSPTSNKSQLSALELEKAMPSPTSSTSRVNPHTPLQIEPDHILNPNVPPNMMHLSEIIIGNLTLEQVRCNNNNMDSTMYRRMYQEVDISNLDILAIYDSI